MKRILILFAAGLAVCTAQAQEVGFCTDKGRQRDANEDNSDSFVTGKDRICVVCDGVGGAGVGGDNVTAVVIRRNN